MSTSIRNRLPGTIEKIVSDKVVSEVVIQTPERTAARRTFAFQMNKNSFSPGRARSQRRSLSLVSLAWRTTPKEERRNATYNARRSHC
jgi:hypothetical protein